MVPPLRHAVPKYSVSGSNSDPFFLGMEKDGGQRTIFSLGMCAGKFHRQPNPPRPHIQSLATVAGWVNFCTRLIGTPIMDPLNTSRSFTTP